MVAQPRLLEELEVRLELLLVRVRDAVDALQHRVVLVPAPVGPGHGEQLDRADPPGAREVRPAAEVHEARPLV